MDNAIEGYGANWCLAHYMLRNHYKTWSKTAQTGINLKYYAT